MQIMNRERRRLARIEKHLVADDPQLAESFHLWHERCRGAESDGVPGRPGGSSGRCRLRRCCGCS